MRNGSRLTPSSFGSGGMPAAASAVGSTSSWMTGCACVSCRHAPCPAKERHADAALPRLPLRPRSGSLLEPLMVVPGIVGPPLSLMKKTSVFSSRPRVAQLRQIVTDGVVHRRHHGRVGAALSSAMTVNASRYLSVACIGVCTALNAR